MTLEEHYAQGLFPIHHERWQKFPKGESLDDLAQRAEKAVQEVILPHVLSYLGSGARGSHIAVASHGLFIAEMVPALLKMDPTSSESRTTFRGMHNTAWTRVTVDLAVSKSKLLMLTCLHKNQEVKRDKKDSGLRVKVTDFNSHAHLNSIVSRIHS